MDNIISIIERLGADCTLKGKVVNAKHLMQVCDPDIQNAILSSDIEKLEKMLNVRNKIVCMIFPVEEPKEQPEQPDEEDQPEGSKVAVAV
tara:strand:- start:172 stop:441 length:270 start_codon:yes stop_codon:yes gene_type:complete